ncbi:CPBP family intramembrane glutamic endopeptidase [Polymorphospora rubra]|uniref:CPBP family intramembrane glutamic endopeptidase n=1 Tax=Polymorphospora rubra TaxID=338584 RepID=UPI0033D4B508
MSTPILSLSLLVLVSVAFPGQAFRLLLTGAGGPPRPGAVPAAARRFPPEVGFAVALLAVAALAVAVTPAGLVVLTTGDPLWYAVAVVLGLAAPFLEYLLGAGVLLARRQRVGGIGVHERVGLGPLRVLAALGIAVAEEILFRSVALGLLLDPFGLLSPLAIGLTALVYGLNHLYYGWLTVAQKTLTGLWLGALFVLSGHSLLVPLIAHVVQNLVVLVLLPRWNRP